MTVFGKLAALFPIFHAGLILYSVVNFVWHPNLIPFLFLVCITYLLPPLLFRLYALKFPVKAGRWILNRPERCDWWIAHQCQMVYAAIPSFESILRLIPGAYSAWLRLWGSKVGKRVYWTVGVEILDRHMLEVGDDVVFGHKVYCTSHIIYRQSKSQSGRQSKGDLVLVLRKPCIGSGTLIGAGSRIGPGVQIPANTTVPYNTEYRFTYDQEIID